MATLGHGQKTGNAPGKQIAAGLFRNLATATADVQDEAAEDDLTNPAVVTAPPTFPEPKPAAERPDGYEPDRDVHADELPARPAGVPSGGLRSRPKATIRVTVQTGRPIRVTVVGGVAERMRARGTGATPLATASKRLLLLNWFATELLSIRQEAFFRADERLEATGRRTFFRNPLAAATALLEPVDDQDALLEQCEATLTFDDGHQPKIDSTYKTQLVRLGVETPLGVFPLGLFWPQAVDLLKFWWGWAAGRAGRLDGEPPTGAAIEDSLRNGWAELWDGNPACPKWIAALRGDPEALAKKLKSQRQLKRPSAKAKPVASA